MIEATSNMTDTLTIRNLHVAVEGKPILPFSSVTGKGKEALVGREIHALSLQTYTPEQWNKARQLRVI